VRPSVSRQRAAEAAALAVGLALLAALAIGAVAGTREARTDSSIAYHGPLTLRPGAKLTAKISLPSSRVVGVAFLLDGRPIASDTAPPYTAVVLPEDLRRSTRGVMRVRVLTRNARTIDSPAVRVRLDERPVGRIIRAGPAKNLRRAVAALAAGRVTVLLAPGEYDLGHLRLGSGARLIGSGPQTTLLAPQGEYEWVVGVRGDDVIVADLAIDGRGPGKGGGYGVVVHPGSEHVVLRRLTISRIRRYGVHAYGEYSEVSVQDSSIDGAGTADSGVLARVADAGDVSVIRSRITRFRSFGINFQKIDHDEPERGARNVALDNVITDIRDTVDTDGRSQGGIWSGGAAAAIVGNVVTRAAWDGIETVGSSEGVLIARNRISETRFGIYLEHETDGTTVMDNTISKVELGMIVEWRYDGVGSERNTFLRNTVSGATRNSMFLDLGADENLISGNRFLGAGGSSVIILQGSSGNRIVDNFACAAPGALVVERTARSDEGALVAPGGNEIARNVVRPVCPSG